MLLSTSLILSTLYCISALNSTSLLKMRQGHNGLIRHNDWHAEYHCDVTDFKWLRCGNVTNITQQRRVALL